MTRYWTATLPFAPLAARCLAALSGEAPAEGYLAELLDLAWQGTGVVMGEDWPAAARLTVDRDGTAEAALVSVDAAGVVAVSLSRLRALALYSLDLAEHLSRGFVVRYLFGADNLPALVELDGFEERAVPNANSPWYDLDGGLFVDELIRSAEAAVGGEPGQQSQALPRFDFGLLHTDVRQDRYELLFDPANGPYVLRLHHHLFVNALLFALLHECAHLALGHFDDTAQPAPGLQRRREIDADAEALRLLTDDADGDIRAAISILRYTNAVDPEPAGSSLSHPHSADRLALLAEAIRATGDAALAQDINETLRELVHSGGQMTDEQGNTTELFVSGDLDAAYLEARVHEPVTEGVTWAAWDREPRIAVRTQVRYRDPADPAIVLADATVHVYFTAKLHVSFDGERQMLTHILRTRIATPPTWRIRWPDARLAITSVTDLPQEWSRQDMAAMRTMADKKRYVVWDQPDEALLGIMDLAADTEIRGDVRSLVEWARWCDEYGLAAESLALRAAVAEQAPTQVAPHLVSTVLGELLEVGDSARAHQVALTYVQQTARMLPGVQLVAAVQAAEDGDGLAAFDHAFAEVHGFGPDNTYGPTAESVLMQAVEDHADNPDLAALLDFFGLYQRYASTHGRHKRKSLDQAREILDRRLTARAIDLLSVRQLRAECSAEAWRHGERGADTAALHLFEQLAVDYPWFVAANAQMAHLYLDRGDRAAAVRCVQQAELTAPTHPQIVEVRERIVQAMT
jgi:hypothetical protein